MRARRILLSLVGPIFVSACALVADLGERTLGDPNAVTGGDGGKDGSSTKRDASKSDPKDSGDTEPDTDFCDGIILYASFDGKLTGDVGGESTASRGAVSTSPNGKFGGALALVGNNSAVDSPGAAHFFLASNAGNPWSETVGSLAVWFRASQEYSADKAPVLYRPMASLPDEPLKTAGLAFYLQNDRTTGFFEKSSTSIAPVFVFNTAAVAPFLRKDDYNHFFTAWNQDGSPTAMFAINGGQGTVFDGSSPGTFPEGEAPYRATTTKLWASEGPPVGLRLGGSGTNSPQGTFDDLVVWNRVLTFEQAAAVFKAGKSVGEVCDLP